MKVHSFCYVFTIGLSLYKIAIINVNNGNIELITNVYLLPYEKIIHPPINEPITDPNAQYPKNIGRALAYLSPLSYNYH